MSDDQERYCGMCRQKDSEIERLRGELEREKMLGAAYKCLPEEYHQGMLELLVRAAFEAAEISHGRAAELLQCTVMDIRERNWVQGRKDEEIERLRSDLDRLKTVATAANIWLFEYGNESDRARVACDLNKVLCELADKGGGDDDS